MIVTEKEAELFLENNGFPVVKRIFCEEWKDCEQAVKKLGFPVVMKIASSKIFHKSDVQGVVLNITSLSALKRAFVKMNKIKHFEGVLVQEYLEGDALLLGLKKDATFGHTVAVGSGGIYTEVLKDISFRVCPLTGKDADEMMEELKFYPVIKGIRGRKDMRKKVKDMLLRLSLLAKNYPMIRELDINPLLLVEQGVVVADARMIVETQEFTS